MSLSHFLLSEETYQKWQDEVENRRCSDAPGDSIAASMCTRPCQPPEGVEIGQREQHRGPSIGHDRFPGALGCF